MCIYFVRSIFGDKNGVKVKRLADDDSDEEGKPLLKKVHIPEKPTDILADVSCNLFSVLKINELIQWN